MPTVSRPSGLSAALLFDDAMMLKERGDRFAILGQRMRRKTQFCLLIDRVDHLSRRQNAAEAVGDLLCGLRRHRHADEVGVAAHRQVIGHDLERCRDFALHTAISFAHLAAD